MLKIDAVSQMRVEYQNAIVHQARVQQAQRIREEVQKNQDDLEDAVKSAMCPFLVLEVRRDRLIEDTLNQIHLKVRKKVSLTVPLGSTETQLVCQSLLISVRIHTTDLRRMENCSTINALEESCGFHSKQ